MRKLRKMAIGLVILFVVIQLVPFGRDHSNPPVVSEPAWDSPETRATAKRACFDCHSHESVWPWYSHVAPVSWLVQLHVEEGRQHLNFSTWDRAQKHAKDMGEVLREGEMPFPAYLPAHPEARLTDAERETLASALEKLPEPGTDTANGAASDGDGADNDDSGDDDGDDDYEG